MLPILLMACNGTTRSGDASMRQLDRGTVYIRAVDLPDDNGGANHDIIALAGRKQDCDTNGSEVWVIVDLHEVDCDSAESGTQACPNYHLEVDGLLSVDDAMTPGLYENKLDIEYYSANLVVPGNGNPSLQNFCDYWEAELEEKWSDTTSTPPVHADAKCYYIKGCPEILSASEA